MATKKAAKKAATKAAPKAAPKAAAPRKPAKDLKVKDSTSKKVVGGVRRGSIYDI